MAQRQLLILLAAVSLAAGSAFGQAVSGNIVGVLMDQAGASIPGVVVELKDLSSGAVRTFTTAEEGIFRFNNLPPRAYTLTAKAKGFKTYTEQDIIAQCINNAIMVQEADSCAQTEG